MVWIDGAPHDTSVVPFDITDRGLLLGDGVFDTALVLGHAMAWRAAHVSRLVAGCRAIGFAPDETRIQAAIDALLPGVVDGSLRLTLTRGPGPRGLAPPLAPRPTVLATTAPLRPTTLFAPMALHLTAIRRNDTSPTARLKSLGYLDAVLAAREAAAAGCDDALFLNTLGRVACTGTGNIIALFGDHLVTPPLTDGVLDGITRASILATCGAIGVEPSERSLSLEDLLAADAVCVTSSLRLVAPVTRVGSVAIGSATAPCCLRLIAHVAGLIEADTGIDVRPLAF